MLAGRNTGRSGWISAFLKMMLFMIVASLTMNVLARQEGGTMETDVNRADMVILGASYAAGWKISQLKGLTIINKGIGGQESHEMLARIERDVLALQPKYVVIWGFINDIFRADKEKLDERLKQTRRDLQSMVSTAIASGVVPILATEVTITTPGGISNMIRGLIAKIRGKESYADFVNREVKNVNEWMRNYAQQQRIALMEFERLLADQDGLRRREFATDDGSHITEAGYRRLTEYANQKLPQLIGR